MWVPYTADHGPLRGIKRQTFLISTRKRRKIEINFIFWEIVKIDSEISYKNE